MSYRRALLVLDLGADARGAVAALRRAAPGLEQLIVVAGALPPRHPFWPSPAPPPTAQADRGRLLAEAAGAARDVTVEIAPDLGDAALARIAAGAAIDLVVVGPVDRRGKASVLEARRSLGVTVLWAQDGAPATPDAGPAPHLLCVAIGARDLAAIGMFLRDNVAPDARVALLALAPPAPLDDLPALLEMAGVRAQVQLLPVSLRPLPRLLEWARLVAVDLVVVARPPPMALLDGMARWPLPVLVLPPIASARAGPLRPLDASDLVDDGGALRGRVEQASRVGRPAPVADEAIAFVGHGRVVATALAREGEVELGVDPGGGSLGLYRVSGAADEDALAAVERTVTVLRPGPRPVLLFDAALDRDELALVRTATAALDAPEPIAVRVRPAQSFELVRGRLRAAGLSLANVIDATAILGEGEPLDVPDEVDAVRLARVAARLRGAGFRIAAIVHRGLDEPATAGFAALRPGALAHLGPGTSPPPPGPPGSLAARLNATTATSPLAGNLVELELDNVHARGLLLAAIAGSRRRVHLQVYMVGDDDAARAIEQALVDAAARRVAVRVLVDSLHGLHGSLGAHNPLLARLAARPGVDVRVSRPVTGVPSLRDLKQRDHRKLAVIDGSVALLGGRNLAHEYYTGFAEVRVTPETPWRQIPWLDAGARVEGPAVAALERAFLDAWSEAGGDAFQVDEPAPAGPTSARIVVHRGMRDAYTLEAYLALIDTARSRLDVVNSFPLQLEVQHALVRALRRGVRVRVLMGNVLPTHGDEPFGGPLAAARALATQFVHSRLDAVIAAGGACHELALHDVPGWDPALGVVRPHVHAKVVSADGGACAVGSANLDITAAYWESELLLVVEDAATVSALEARLDALFAASRPVDRGDPAWQALAARRSWMRHWPGMLG